MVKTWYLPSLDPRPWTYTLSSFKNRAWLPCHPYSESDMTVLPSPRHFSTQKHTYTHFPLNRNWVTSATVCQEKVFCHCVFPDQQQERHIYLLHNISQTSGPTKKLLKRTDMRQRHSEKAHQHTKHVVLSCVFIWPVNMKTVIFI